MKPVPILVIEDSPEDFDTVVEAAKRMDLQNPILRAQDAFEAVRLLGIEAGAKPAPPFGLLILDYNLPGKTGVEFLREYAQTTQYWQTPVIVLTSSSSLVDCRECYRAGASAYHAKSVNYKESLSTITMIFSYWLKSAKLPGASGTNS